MLRPVLALLLWLSVLPGHSQNASSPAVLPLIDITLTGGERFTNRDLKQGPLVLIYFSPDCGHCKQFITDFLQRDKLARSRQVLLTTFVEVNTLKSFEEAMGLKKYPNIKTGTEGESYRIAKSLSIRKFPYVALYDSSRRLIKSFEGEQPFSWIAEEIGKM